VTGKVKKFEMREISKRELKVILKNFTRYYF